MKELWIDKKNVTELDTFGSRFTAYYAKLLEPVSPGRLRLQITDKDDRITTL